MSIVYAAKDPPRFSSQARYLIDATLTPLEVLRHPGFRWRTPLSFPPTGGIGDDTALTLHSRGWPAFSSLTGIVSWLGRLLNGRQNQMRVHQGPDNFTPVGARDEDDLGYYACTPNRRRGIEVYRYTVAPPTYT